MVTTRTSWMCCALFVLELFSTVSIVYCKLLFVMVIDDPLHWLAGMRLMARGAQSLSTPDLPHFSYTKVPM